MDNRLGPKLDEARVWDILLRLYAVEVGDSTEDISHIAAEFEVSIKTIERIRLGQTWLNVKTRFDIDPQRQLQRIVLSKPEKAAIIWPEDYHDQCNTIEATKRGYHLDPTQPIHWGAYDDVDGVVKVATDGTVLWRSPDLFKFARLVARTRHPEAPFFATKANELPTFELASLMSHPLLKRCHIRPGHKGVTCLEGNTALYVASRYCEHFDPTVFCFYSTDSEDFVYIVNGNTVDGIIATLK